VTTLIIFIEQSAIKLFLKTVFLKEGSAKKCQVFREMKMLNGE
jgi:hypothetical protein